MPNVADVRTFLSRAWPTLLAAVVAALVAAARPDTGLAQVAPPSTAVPASRSPTVPHDGRYFPETAFRIDHDSFWEYFNARGRQNTFGFPISRTIVFLGCTTQFFQRQLMQQCPGAGVRTMNLLDPDLMPYNRINRSTFSAHDPQVAGGAPAPGTPNYGVAVLNHMRSVAPDTFQELPVNFFNRFVSTVPGSDPARDPNQAALVNLEIWGFPTSRPAFDPANRNFVYQRFQRGIMHYDHATRVTAGILLADWFKVMITNDDNLPSDLEQQVREGNSPYYNQYCRAMPRWVCRPAQLTNTDLSFAFEQG